MNKGKLSERLLATFLDELDEQVRTLNSDLLALETNPVDPDRLRSVFRVAHTLKGAARAANVPPVEEASHALETVLAGARDGSGTLGAEQFRILFAAADAFSDAGRRIRAGESLHDSLLADLTRALREGEGKSISWGNGESRARPRNVAPQTAPAPAAPSTASPETAHDQDTHGSLGDEQVRVATAKLDGLLAIAGELLIGSGRTKSGMEQLESLQAFATRWASEWQAHSVRLRAALERAGVPTAATRVLSDTERHVRQLVQDTTRLAQQAARDSHALSRIADDVMERTRRLRMRPFSEAAEALPRLVRDLATETGKEVEIEISGGDVEADRIILDGLREALVHIVRNAVDHGMEPPSERERKGKPRRGLIAVSASFSGDNIVVSVKDDGAGLHLDAIRAQLRSRGRAVPDDDQALARILFEGGFSTRSEASAISGRGVGLDVVAAAVDRIRGAVDVTWTPGRGTTFTMSAPLTLATVRALLVMAGSQTIAIPTSAVERLLRVELEEIREIDGQRVMQTPEGPVPLATLARLLGPPLADRSGSDRLFVVMLAVGRRRVAVAVDELLEEDELVIRPVGRRRIPRLAGAALLPTGRVALVVNPPELVGTELVRSASTAGVSPAVATKKQVARRRILLADDSITTRTLEQSVLEAAGFDVIAAVDGADAWRLLNEKGADLVVTDIEMPRMDGFALAEKIRSTDRTSGIPIVIVTSLETEENRARGLEAGADAYVVKTSFDQEALLSTIRQLLR